MNNLKEHKLVLFFDGDAKKRMKYIRAFKGRFENDNHFIRCAIMQYQRVLDQELLNKIFNEKKVRR